MVPSFPRVSIVMATWNRARMLDRTIESVRKQTFADWELIVPDDGSTDDTAKVMAALEKKDSRITFIPGPHRGIPQNYNKGLKACRGEYIAMIDDDDPWCDDEKLKKQMLFLDGHPDHVGVGGGMIIVNSAGVELYRYLKPETDTEIRNKILFSNPMANSTTMFRRTAALKAGWYSEDRAFSSDRDFWLKMGRVGKLHNLQEYLSYYTVTNTNTTTTHLRKHLRDAFMIMRKYKNDYPHYYPALAFNAGQYLLGLLPRFIEQPFHALFVRVKRFLVT